MWETPYPSLKIFRIQRHKLMLFRYLRRQILWNFIRLGRAGQGCWATPSCLFGESGGDHQLLLPRWYEIYWNITAKICFQDSIQYYDTMYSIQGYACVQTCMFSRQPKQSRGRHTNTGRRPQFHRGDIGDVTLLLAIHAVHNSRCNPCCGTRKWLGPQTSKSKAEDHKMHNTSGPQ